ncbi:hypothetical protein [Leifsonia shinshuensis]
MQHEIAGFDLNPVAVVVDPVTHVELAIPAFSTADAVIAREARRRAGGLRVVRFFADHCHRWPLWDASVGYTAEPGDFDVSDDLTTALRRWYDDWELAVGPGEPWVDRVAERTWHVRGDQLARQLAEELWSVAIVYAASAQADW